MYLYFQLFIYFSNWLFYDSVDCNMGDKNQIEHNSVLSQSLDSFRKRGIMCDVTIIIGEEEFPAHRLVLSAASEYFETMFNVEMKENVTGRVGMQDISVPIFKSCLEYVYTGLINIHADNVHELLKASSLQQIQDLKKLCLNFMQENLSVKTCMESFNMSKLYESDKLRESVEGFMIKNFEQVSKSSDFNKFMDEAFLGKILASDKLKIPSEKILYEIVMSWIRYDSENREELFPQLFQQLRLSLFPVDYLYAVMSEEIIRKNEKYVKMIQEAIAQVYMGKVTEMRRSVDNFMGKRLLLMKKDVTLSENAILSFTPETNTWNNFPGGSAFSAVSCAVMDNKLYAVGSTLEMSILDLNNNKWSTVDGDGVDRGNFALAVHQGDLFLVGGNEPDSYRSVSSYSSITQQWKEQPSMNKRRYRLTLNSLGGALYAFGDEAPEKFFKNVWSPIQNCVHSDHIKVSTVKDGLIYAIGQRKTHPQPDVFMNIYHPADNFWSCLNDFALSSGISGVCNISGELYFVRFDVQQKSSIRRIDLERKSFIIVSQKFDDWSNVCLVAY
uniref:kelch-like protein 2 n=1 Tax=Styela clava TaxID=7725 RepID=UPI00193A76AE|nr:kelch-like protein 2 [Styela clava]